MVLKYEHPILLIEYEKGMLQYNNKDEVSISDFVSKMVLLTKSFPKLEIIWSCSSAATCEIFSDLKRDMDDPIEELHSDPVSNDSAARVR
jgi:ERCC4-type nuclease